MSNYRSNNQTQVIAARDSITGLTSYPTTTNSKLDVNATASIAGSSIPISGATTAIVTAIVDGSGNQITTFGGGTQYTTGSAEATPTGTMSLGWDGTTVKALPLDASGFLKVNVAAGGGSGGTSSSFGSAFPATGTAIGATDGTNMQSLKVDGSKNLLTSLQTALPAGTNVIGHVITDTGSVTAATQSGTWNITNISGTVSLPTGAATAAKQPALGTAGTPSADVITVQGITSMTALKVDGTGGTFPVSGTVAATQSGTWNITNISGTVSLPTGAATATNQTGGSQKTQIVDGSGNVIASTSNALNVSSDLAQSAESTAAWTSATTGNTTLALATVGYGTATVFLNQGSTITGGVVTFEASDTDAGTNWYTVTMVSTDGNISGSSYTLQQSTNVAFQMNTAGFRQFRVRLSTVISGTGTVNVGIAAQASTAEWDTHVFGAVGLDAGSNIVGKVGIDQTTPGTTNKVSIGTDGTVAATQSGSWTVTANAGTNLNTSSLALETGGNLASVATNTTNIPNVVGTAAAAIPTKLLQVGGSDGTNARAIKTNTSGQMDIRPLTSSDQVTTVPSGTQTVSGTVAATQSGTWTVQPGNTANTTAWLVAQQGNSVSSQTSLTTTATVSSAAGTFVGGSFINLNSAPAYIQVFDTTGAVTLGTTTPTFVQPIPANSTAANGAAYVFSIPGGITIANGIKIAATTTATGATTVSTGLTGYVVYR